MFLKASSIPWIFAVASELSVLNFAKFSLPPTAAMYLSAIELTVTLASNCLAEGLLDKLAFCHNISGIAQFSKPSAISAALPATKILLCLGKMVAFTAFVTSASVTWSIDFR